MGDGKNILEQAKQRAAQADAENNPAVRRQLSRPTAEGKSSGRPEGSKPSRPMNVIQHELREMASASAEHDARVANAEANADGRVALEELTPEAKAEQEREAKLASSVIYQHTPLDNPVRRKEIEKRLEPLGFDELLLLGHVVQTVYLGKHLSVTFQSPTVKETSWIQHTSLSKYPLVTQNALRNHWTGHATLTFAIRGVRGVTFPPNNGVNEDGLSEVNLEIKREMIARLPDMVLSVIAINHGWFTDRVQKLFLNDFEELKNG